MELEKEKFMKQRLRELKEEIKSFIIENGIKEFYVDIERSASAQVKVEITIKA